MSGRSLLDDEPGALATLLQARALLRAGLAHFGWTLAGTCLLLAALAGSIALRGHDYAPRFVLRDRAFRETLLAAYPPPGKVHFADARRESDRY